VSPAVDFKEAAIKGVPLFSTCSRKEIAEIARLSEKVRIPRGEDLMREGEVGSELFIILAGVAEVRRGDTVVKELGAGDFCGELALIEHVPRSATVTTTSPIVALTISSEAFARLRGRLPNMDRAVLDEMTARVRENAARDEDAVGSDSRTRASAQRPDAE
jgi:CRP/FNR family cyclic AMP-dependent transcriptional regulator